MGISIQPKNDYSALLSSLNTSGNGGAVNTNLLSDYASIKNGSYGKLLKAYYAKDGKANVKATSSQEPKDAKSVVEKLNTSTSVDSAKTISDIEKSAEDLKKVSSAVLDNEDSEKRTSSIKDFINGYNDLISKIDTSDNTTLLNKGQNLVDLTFNNEDLLSKAGITIGKDLRLSVDEQVLEGADEETLSKLFEGPNSYAFAVSTQADGINIQASYEAIKANTYTESGTFGAANNAGSLFDNVF